MAYFKVMIVIILLKLNVWHLCSAIDIQNVTTTGQLINPYAYSGVVTVKFQDVWGYVCYYGSKKRWGKREATTACKQLGYTGGWPTMNNETESSTHNLYNFDCDEYLEDLNRCEFDVITDCERSVIAGIQCYNSFEVNIVGGKTPNIGRIQVEYDDVVSDVCYSREDSIPWESHNTLVLCRELGYPGAMFDMGDSDHEMGQSTISGYECNTDKDKSLQDCYPDLPFNNSESCTGIIAACAMPGYVGCFNNNNNNNNPSEPQTSVKLVNMTINECRHYCRESVKRYAFLSRGDTCACSADITENTIDDKLCNSRCFGDSDQACGGNSTVSVYDVTQGICNDPWDWKRTYFFGEILIPECQRGTRASNLNPVQCVLSKQTGKCTWNSTEVLECSDRNDPERGDNNKDDNMSEFKIPPSIIVVVVIITAVVVSIIICGLIHIKRKRDISGKDKEQSNDRVKDKIKSGSDEIIRIDNHFGKSTATYELTKHKGNQNVSYKNRKYLRRAKKHKPEYTKVSAVDPVINSKKHETSQTVPGEPKQEEVQKFEQKREPRRFSLPEEHTENPMMSDFYELMMM